MSQLIIAKEFKVIGGLTKGHSAQIKKGISLKNGRSFAVKLQSHEKFDSILKQASIIRNIQANYQLIVDYGLPYCYAAGTEGKYNYSLLDRLGSNLSDLLKQCKGIFTIKTFLMLADQMIKRVEFLHRQDYIHRGINLKKFVIGLEKSSKRLYLCGLGQGKRFRKDGQHIPYRQGKKANKKIVYQSINIHLGIQASRRDDLESIMYCWVKMLYGKLPWEDEEDYDKMLSKKIQNSGAVILGTFPLKLQAAYDYCRGLGFDEDPNYNYLRSVIMDLFCDYNLEYDYDYDWQESAFDDPSKL